MSQITYDVFFHNIASDDHLDRLDLTHITYLMKRRVLKN